ncbi:MAG: cob(I)yrinic acid a,c-diamide adenosyltransferase [Thermoplasmata archaeon]|nr:MAG: cob(I)yrinic acid a,c-diamide adenosyltransferase [Thermoplasmata archaeon]
MKGRVIVYTGEAQGKTTASLGVALRSIAHSKRVVIIQFMKGRKDTGEYLIKDVLPNYEIYQFGRKDFVDLSNPDDEDKRLAREAINFAKEKLKEKPFLLILDEINIACHINLIPIEDVMDLIKSKPEETNLILTGRYADEKLIELADIVTEMKEVKRESVDAVEGIEF